MKVWSRRKFLSTGGLGVLGLAAGPVLARKGNITGTSRFQSQEPGFGPLVFDPQKILELPQGFVYQIISRSGQTMSDGFKVPGNPDGMGAFPGPDGLTLVMRNHEVWSDYPPSSGPFGPNNELLGRVRRYQMYDWVRSGSYCLGAVTTLVYNTASQELQNQFLSLCGTMGNCSGGATPWGTWISCEEEFHNRGFHYSQNHGYAFEVEVDAGRGIQKPKPLKALGRFIHEGAAFDPHSEILYLTEDQSDSMLYRFVPDKPGNLSSGGKLQCLAIVDAPGFDTRNWKEVLFQKGESKPVEWIDLENGDSKNNDLRLRGFQKGGALFANGEGIVSGKEAVYFACTFGGRTKTGQIWKYYPSQVEGKAEEIEAPGRLELFVQPENSRVLFNPDQMTVAPWGDLLVCEDNPQRRHLKGITPAGEIYTLARNVMDESELAGVCFSPDHSTLFLNMQNAGLTFAITGPWKKT